MPVNSLNFDDILEKIEKDLKSPGKITTIYTPNAEIVMVGYFNSYFQSVMQQFDLGLPDGSSLIWAGNMLGQPLQKRITGGEAMEKLILPELGHLVKELVQCRAVRATTMTRRPSAVAKSRLNEP